MAFFRTHRLIITEVLMTVFLVVFFVLCVGGRTREDLSLATLQEAIAPKLSGAAHMKEAGAMKLRAIYGLEANAYEEILLYIPASNMDAQEMLLIRCKNEEQTEAVSQAMKQRIQEQIGIFESYGMEQMALIRKAVVDVQGLYCLYLCDMSSYEGRSAFREALSR